MRRYRNQPLRRNKGTPPVDSFIFTPPQTGDSSDEDESEKRLDLLTLNDDAVTVAVPVTREGRQFLTRYSGLVKFIDECRHRNQVWYFDTGQVDAASVFNAAQSAGLTPQMVASDDLEEIVEGCGCRMGDYRSRRPNPARESAFGRRFHSRRF